MALARSQQDLNKELTQLQILAQINALIALLPPAIGTQVAAQSLSVILASDSPPIVTSDLNVDMELTLLAKQNQVSLTEIVEELKLTNTLLKSIVSS